MTSYNSDVFWHPVSVLSKPSEVLIYKFRVPRANFFLKVVLCVDCFSNAVVGLHPQRIVSHMASHQGERANGRQINRFPEVLLKAAVDLLIVLAVSPFYWNNPCSISSLTFKKNRESLSTVSFCIYCVRKCVVSDYYCTDRTPYLNFNVI